MINSVNSNNMIILPGEVLKNGVSKLGEGLNLYKIFNSESDKTHASVIGFKKKLNGEEVYFGPANAKYNPVEGDTGIGIVSEVLPNLWIVDINAGYPGILLLNEVPGYIEFGNTKNYLNIGEAILFKIKNVDELKRILITIKGMGLKKIETGTIFKTNMYFEENNKIFEKIEEKNDCKIFKGDNKTIWIEGDSEIVFSTLNMLKEVNNGEY